MGLVCVVLYGGVVLKIILFSEKVGCGTVQVELGQETIFNHKYFTYVHQGYTTITYSTTEGPITKCLL